MGAVVSLRNAVLDKILRAVNFTTQATHLSLHTGDPGSTGANEATGGPGPYARQAISFNAASSGQSTNSNAQTFTGLAAGTYTHVGLWTAVSAGTFLWKGTMTASKTVDAGDTIEFVASTVTVPTTGA